MEFFENIKDWFVDIYKEPSGIYMKPYWKIKQFWYQLKRSSKWFIRMWNNYDWDYTYLIEMIVLKLKDMRYQFDNVDCDYVDLRHQPGEGSDTVDNLAEMDKAIEIGERLLKDDYTHYTPRIQKWFDEHDIFDSYHMPDDMYRELMEIYEKSNEVEQKDREDFFNLIRDNHLSWWS